MRLFTGHKKAPHGGSAGPEQRRKERKTEMKPFDKKMMHQKSPHVKRHNGPLAFTRAENAMTRVENAIRERRRHEHYERN
jgi:hypothetical protein